MDNEASLTPIREAHAFDKNALSKYLSAQLDLDFSGMNTQQFEGGQSNPTFMIENLGTKYVMRKKPPGKLLKSAHAVEREYRIMHALRDTDVPVPKMHHLCEDDSIIGTPFYLMECVEGRMCSNPHLEEFTPEDRRALFDNALGVMAALHKVDVDAVGLSDYGRPGNYYARQISRWTRQYVDSKTSEIEGMEKLMKWLPENTPESEESGIVHGDFRTGNFIIDMKEPKVVAVLDWELSTLGHPLADLAHFITYANNAHAEGVDPTIPQEQEIVDTYCKHSGRPGIKNFNFYMVFSIFRMAAIGQGVYKRGLEGNASSQFWERAGKSVPPQADRACDLAGI
jgi:aminoglycoside phosphotransferase (APT) family kinase protein